MREAAACGVTHIRTHVDIDTEAGLRNLAGVLATRDLYRDVVDMQIVAFPQSGLLVRPGTQQLLDEALTLGADLLGGLDPCAIDRDPGGHLDSIFELAVKHDVDLDIHLHEGGELGGFSMELILERIARYQYQGRVTVSHAFCLGTLPEPQLGRLIDALAEAKVTIMSLGTGKGEFPPLKRLADAGVALCTGTDGIQDTWSPNNVPDILERVRLLAYRSGIRHDQDFEWLFKVATADGARLLGAKNYGLEVGQVADLFLVAAQSVAQAIVERPNRTLVLKRGKIIAENGVFKALPE